MKISEKFYSIQAEGATIGVPAYFIRLPGCNLMCGGTGGELMESGSATWWCDSESLWKQSTEVSNAELIEEWNKEGILNCIKSGRIHLVWTGGEPALPRSARDIFNFISEFKSQWLYNELETNGTVVVPETTGDIDLNFYELFQQINCSPKLANSGIAKEERIVPGAVEQVMRNSNYWFKFVVSNEDDVKEAFNDYIIPFNIEPTRVILMPGCDSQEEIIERTTFAFEMAKKYSVRAVTRAQIMCYGKRAGV